MEAGQLVRLKSDPGRQGVLTGKFRERAGVKNYQVVFPEGSSYIPEYELEFIEEDNSDPFDLVRQGRFGRVSDLRRNLSHIQLSGRLANLVYSMDTTNTDFYAYQFKPVLSFLESPSNGLLIADEVGLGKTIEAGLIWTELRKRYDSRRLVVVCPAMLREKWKEELQNRFGVEASILNAAELLSELRRSKDDIPDGRAVICSIQGLRPPKNWRDEIEGVKGPRHQLAEYLDEQTDSDPIIDLLIVDEAHYLRNPKSQNAKLGQLLRGVSDHVALLSATPVNLHDDDLFHLLNLVDPDSFDVKGIFPQVLEANEPLIKARKAALDLSAGPDDIKGPLIKAQQHKLLSDNLQLKELIKTTLNAEVLNSRAERVKLANRIEKVNLLRHAVSRTRKAEVTEWRVVRKPFTEYVPLNQTERDFYDVVTNAIRIYAIKADISEGFLLASPQRQVSSCMYAAAKSWKGRIDSFAEQLYEDLGIETEQKLNLSPLIQHICDYVMPTLDLESLRRHDSKYEKFRKSLLKYLKDSPKEKVIVFSYFRGTLEYLIERLGEDGINCQILMGGMKETKHDIIKHFRDDPKIKVLLSSEVASEGVDLQFCRLLINYDLPWNPMRVEQRIGRLDRIGQESPSISIWNLCYEGTIDQRIVQRLFDRLHIFERALGSMEAILGDKISDLTADLLMHQLTPEEEEQRIDQTALAVECVRHDQEELEKEASNLIAHGGYILEAVQAAHDFNRRITEQDLYVYVRDYLNRYCQWFTFLQLQTDKLIFDLQLPPSTAVELSEFIRKKKLFGQTNLQTGETRRCQFINKVMRSNAREEHISQFHPLVRFISEDLRARDEAFYPLVAIRVPQKDLPKLLAGQYAFAVSCWVFSGLRTQEELRARIYRLGGNDVPDSDLSWDIVNTARVAGQDWLSVNSDIEKNVLSDGLDICAEQLTIDFQQERKNRENENQDRVSFQLQSARRHLDRQLASITNQLENYRMSGRTKMIAPLKGRIRRVKERFQLQEERLVHKGRLTSSTQDVCMGVIDIY